MRRWKTKIGAKVENPAIDRFLEALDTLCKKHGFEIDHEDCNGAFVIVPYLDGGSIFCAVDGTDD